jgi:fumarate reductase flavoprotein subunit
MATVNDTDVVVVGAGLAGHVAALSAAESGLRVALLEKGAEFGGSSTRAGGGLVFAGTDLQRKAGFEDSPARLRESLVATGGGVAREELIDAYVDRQLETYEWMVGQGVGFSIDEAATAEPFTRVHFTGAGTATRHLHDLVEDHPAVEYHPNTPVVRLGREGGRVDRFAVVVDGEEQWRSARRAVVLTSGGFSRGTDLLRTFAPTWLETVPMGGAHNTGDGIVMGWSLGAGLADLPYVAATFGASLLDHSRGDRPGSEPILLYPNYRGAIIVNRDAVRFANEELRYKEMGRICIDQPGGIAFEIFDEQVLERSEEIAVPLDFKAAKKAGLFRQADTIAELADELGLDPDVLKATVERYNAAVESGADEEFGRPIAREGLPGAVPIVSPPYYGYPTKPGLTSTFAGLTVDGSMRVLDVYGTPLDGLYAAGEVVGGFHGAGYYSGTGLGKAAVFGRIAGTAVGRE